MWRTKRGSQALACKARRRKKKKQFLSKELCEGKKKKRWGIILEFLWFFWGHSTVRKIHNQEFGSFRFGLVAASNFCNISTCTLFYIQKKQDKTKWRSAVEWPLSGCDETEGCQWERRWQNTDQCARVHATCPCVQTQLYMHSVHTCIYIK